MVTQFQDGFAQGFISFLKGRKSIKTCEKTIAEVNNTAKEAKNSVSGKMFTFFCAALL